MELIEYCQEKFYSADKKQAKRFLHGKLNRQERCAVRFHAAFSIKKVNNFFLRNAPFL
jgi:hypothetical protein